MPEEIKEVSVRGSVPDFVSAKLHILKGEQNRNIKDIVGDIVIKEIINRRMLSEEEVRKLDENGYLDSELYTGWRKSEDGEHIRKLFTDDEKIPIASKEDEEG